MEDEVNAEQDVFISKDHQRAMAMDNDDDISTETRLTKGDLAPPPAATDDVSEMTGSTRESKAKAYAESAVNEVAKQYTATISTMHNDLGAKDDKIAQLELMLAQLHRTTPAETQLIVDLDNPQKTGEEDLTQETIDVAIEQVDLTSPQVNGDEDSTLSKKRTSQHQSPSSQASKRLCFNNKPLLPNQPIFSQQHDKSSPNGEDSSL